MHCASTKQQAAGALATLMPECELRAQADYLSSAISPSRQDQGDRRQMRTH